MKVLFLFHILFLLVACSSRSVKQEGYDAVTIEEFNNMYDSSGRLAQVKIVRTDYFFVDNKKIDENIDVVDRQYFYTSNDEYTIEEISSSGEKEISNYSVNSEEIIRIENDDTTFYRLWRYIDENTPSYTRKRHKLKSILSDFIIDDDNEEYFYYDANNRLIRVLSIDHSTGKTLESWRFDNISFEEALKRVPVSDNEIEVVCFSTQSIRDTVIKRRYVNNTLEATYKEFFEGHKCIEEAYDNSGILETRQEEFVEDGYKIAVNIATEFNTIDSTFYQNNTEVKSVLISPESKVTTITEYDKRGNILIQKTYTKFISK